MKGIIHRGKSNSTATVLLLVICFLVIANASAASFHQAADANIQHNNTMQDATPPYTFSALEVKMSESETKRFWSKVNKNGPTPSHASDLMECWIYEGGKSHEGYGAFFLRGRNHPAHRVAYIATKGCIPAGMVVMHECDNPSCVRHIRLGTQVENLDDMRQKGRQAYTGPKNPARGDRHWSNNPAHSDILRRMAERAREKGAETGKRFLGEKAHFAKLNTSTVLEIRRRAKEGERRAVMAKEFGVSVTVIGNVVTRRSWRHI